MSQAIDRQFFRAPDPERELIHSVDRNGQLRTLDYLLLCRARVRSVSLHTRDQSDAAGGRDRFIDPNKICGEKKMKCQV